MVTIIIPKDQSESDSFALAHRQIAAVFTPKLQAESLTVSIYGSLDGAGFGPIMADGKPIAFNVKSHELLHVFNPQDFAGVMYIKYVLEGYKAKADMRFDTYLVEG